MGDLEAGIRWDLRPKPVETRHRYVWGMAACLSCIYSFYFSGDLFDLFRRKGLFDNGVFVIGFAVGGALPFALYALFLMVIIVHRLPGPYKLRLSEKQLIDCALLVVCSCWTLCFRDLMRTVILGLMLCFHVIPVLNIWWDYQNFGFCDCVLTVVLNIWWDYQNFGFCDCVLTVLIEAALFSCRDNLVLFVTVAVVGVALQLLKSVYQEHHIKSNMEK